MSPVILIIYVAFIVYYMFTLYVFNELSKNPCMCKKLEGFKRTWNFKYVMVATPVLLIGNLFFLYKMLWNTQAGGSKLALYYTVLFILISGYGMSFMNDYAILDLFTIMRTKECPCVKDNREILEKVTYGKFAINSFLIIALLSKYNMKFFERILKKVNKKR